MVVHADAISILNRIDMYMKLKVGSVGDPDIYMGAKLMKVTMDDGNKAWGVSPSKYVPETVRNYELY